MKKLLSTLAGAAIAMTGFASAATIDFAGYAAANGEQGLDEFEVLNIDGFNLVFGAVDGLPLFPHAANPYLNGEVFGKPTGLGVCSTGLTVGDQCKHASDSPIDLGEGVGFGFLEGPFDVTSFEFRDTHGNLLSSAATIAIATLSEAGVDLRIDCVGAFMAMAAMGDAFFLDIDAIGFAKINKPFYISSIDVNAVPVPAAGLLFASGIAGLGYARRKKAAA
ncbi:VPLPA-CTERM sorting domain-containing protein [Parvularcula dongshanensis]|uniref:VPLPA-CTERM sorting domain-containing protein n=1 Tax=Parvularcula dongshanensis TaxID=1173995 RepID=A0A840I4F1_9PROT|nr:VPLPA-CTERM sorting domain-containing protein [Parvularcula dongshanensis]MBB4659143.1 hypothetical protein [Parvularcula dongshanensis]